MNIIGNEYCSIIPIEIITENDVQGGNNKSVINTYLYIYIYDKKTVTQFASERLCGAGESSKKAKGGTFTLKTLNSKWSELTEGGYNFVRFEGEIPNTQTGHKLHLLFRKATENRTRAIELKNWEKVTSTAADESSQFFQYIKSKKEFRYYFNVNDAEAKQAFQNIFKNKEKAQAL